MKKGLKDECKKLFDLKASCREAQLPPKKKSINIQDNFTAKFSVGEEFRKAHKINSDDTLVFFSPGIFFIN